MVESFVFMAMTPELAAYLCHLDSSSGSDYASHRTEAERLRSLVPKPLLDDYYEALKTWYCREGTEVEPAQVHHSPSGRFRVVVTIHATRSGAWHYSKGCVYEGDRLIETVCRNYCAFPFLFVESHPNGHDYLICGADYQGQTVIELGTGARVDWLPPEATDGVGFCWASFTASPSRRTLAVDGCYWACPYEIWLVDFTQPLSPPFPVLHRESAGWTFRGWTGDDACEIEVCREIYVPLNKPVDDLSEEEDADAERRRSEGEEGLFREDKQVLRWTRT